MCAPTQISCSFDLTQWSTSVTIGRSTAGQAPPNGNSHGRRFRQKDSSDENSSATHDGNGCGAGMATATIAAGAQETASVRGTAKNEAKKPYTDYSVRARNVQQGQIGGTTQLDSDGNFSLANLAPAQLLRRAPEPRRESGLHRGTVQPDAASSRRTASTSAATKCRRPGG